LIRTTLTITVPGALLHHALVAVIVKYRQFFHLVTSVRKLIVRTARPPAFRITVKGVGTGA
jgi:hypothetical protein